MEKTKTVELLKNFSARELKTFDQFLRSPYFNTNEKLVRLFIELKKHHPFTDPRKIERQRLYELLYPGETFNDQRIRDLSSDLLEQLELFFSVEALRKSPAIEKRLLLQELNARKHDTLFEARFREARKITDQVTGNYQTFLLNRFLLDETYTRYLHHQYHGRFDKATAVFDYKNTIDHQLEFALWAAFENLSLAYNQHLLHNQPFVLGSYIEPLIRLYEAMRIPSVGIDLLISSLQMAMTHDENYYFRLKAALLGNAAKSIPMDERKNFFMYLTNYCNRKTRGGDERFLTELVELYEIVVGHEVLLLEYGQLQPIFFTNYVLAQLLLGRTREAESFIEKFAGFLAEEFRSDTVLFAKARLAYAQKDYHRALHYLGQVKAVSNKRKIDLKYLVLMIAYDRQDFEQVQFVLDAFQHQVKSERYGPTYQEAALHFAKLFRQLVRVRENHDRQGAEALLEKITSANELSQRFWLKEKAKELVGK